MIESHASRRGTSLPALSLAALLAVAGWSVAAQPADGPADGQDAEPVTVRHDFRPGRVLRYRLQLAGETAWTPPLRAADWGQMATDFTFTLRTKTVRSGGACTFDLAGESLRSTGQTPGGRIDVAAVGQQSRVNLRGRDSVGVTSDNSPLKGPMTITFGPRGEFRFGTGLLPLAIFMVPHVDHRFWNLLTHAPIQAVSPGDQWEVDFNLPVPGAQGKPLRVTGTWQVGERRSLGRRNVLPIELVANLDLTDSKVLLKDGNEIHVAAGSYRASGTATWDVEAGLLSSATARQLIQITADQPVRRTLRSRSQCTLELLGGQEPR